MSELRRRLIEEFRDKEVRHIYCDDFLNASIATQIKVLREQRGLAQADLARLAGMKQSRISALEDVNYASWSIKTLKRLAEAFDLTLTLRFDSFGEKLSEIESFERRSLERPSFEHDLVFEDKVISFSSPVTATTVAPTNEHYMREDVPYTEADTSETPYEPPVESFLVLRAA